MMRIITGKARGIKLNTLEGEATRPPAERIKEAVFSKLQFDIEGRKILDLFSGSGQMALEALSRGATSAVMVDMNRDAVKIMEENALKTKLYPQCKIWRMDYMDYIRRNHGETFDIVFLDPPYAAHLYRPALQALLQYKLLKPTTLIVCESGEGEIFDGDEGLAARFAVVKSSQYSKTHITIFSLKAEE